MTFTQDQAIIVRIDDDGPGIPEEELEQVFTPYYRAEQSRSRDTGGVGLGLAVTKDIIEAHHGSVSLSNLQPHGLRVMIKLTIRSESS